jgi:hypothetical protein
MVSSVGTALDGGWGAAWTEIADRAAKPAQVAMMVRTISRSCLSKIQWRLDLIVGCRGQRLSARAADQEQ